MQVIMFGNDENNHYYSYEDMIKEFGSSLSEYSKPRNKRIEDDMDKVISDLNISNALELEIEVPFATTLFNHVLSTQGHYSFNHGSNEYLFAPSGRITLQDFIDYYTLMAASVYEEDINFVELQKDLDDNKIIKCRTTKRYVEACCDFIKNRIKIDFLGSTIFVLYTNSCLIDSQFLLKTSLAFFMCMPSVVADIANDKMFFHISLSSFSRRFRGGVDDEDADNLILKAIISGRSISETSFTDNILFCAKPKIKSLLLGKYDERFFQNVEFSHYLKFTILRTKIIKDIHRIL